jgi:hypothetical protein
MVDELHGHGNTGEVVRDDPLDRCLGKTLQCGAIPRDAGCLPVQELWRSPQNQIECVLSSIPVAIKHVGYPLFQRSVQHVNNNEFTYIRIGTVK